MRCWLVLASAGLALASPIESGPRPRVTPVYVPPARLHDARRALQPRQSALDPAIFTAQGCLRQNVTVPTINALISAGGPGYALAWCPSTVYTYNDTIGLTAPGQSLSTLGNRALLLRSRTDSAALGSTRATIRLSGSAACAIYGGVRARDSAPEADARSATSAPTSSCAP